MTRPGRTPKLPRLSEAEFMRQVQQLASLCGWWHYHTHDSRRSVLGFPDLVLARDRVLFAELKAEDGKPTPDQLAWLAKLQDAGQEVYLWWPSDWSRIEEILTRR